MAKETKETLEDKTISFIIQHPTISRPIVNVLYAAIIEGEKPWSQILSECASKLKSSLRPQDPSELRIDPTKLKK